MLVASVIRNKIPALLKSRGLTISDLQRMTGLSYPTAYSLAKEKGSEIISDETRLGTLRQICEALEVTPNDLLEVIPSEE